MIGGIVETDFDELLATARVTHGYGQPGIMRHLPLIHVQQVDPGETNPPEVMTQLRQCDCPIRPATYGLFKPACWCCGFCVVSRRQRRDQHTTGNSAEYAASARVVDLAACADAKLLSLRCRCGGGQNRIPG